MTLTGPWYITASAIRDYLRIVGEEPAGRDYRGPL
jgi:hypothetical protein